jgi:hypothetical protein
MGKTDKTLVEVAELCLGLEDKAERLYGLFATMQGEHSLRRFWERMSSEEKGHKEYWGEVLALADRRTLPQVLENPRRTLDELLALAGEMEGALQEAPRASTVDARFALALRMETAMLHPAFAILFQFIGCNDERCPGRDYEDHLRRLVDQVRLSCKQTVETELVGKLVQMLWRDNLKMAGQMSQIRELNALIPICASCKKIRDDTGRWVEMELFFQEHGALEFTHGCCPDCIRKLYSNTPDGPVDLLK